MPAFDPAMSEEGSLPSPACSWLAPPALPASYPPGLGRMRGRAALSPWGLISKKVTKALVLPRLHRD